MDKSMNTSKGDKILHIVFHIVLILIAVCCVYPFLIIVSSSFTPDSVISKNGYSAIPREFSVYAYTTIFNNPSAILSAYEVTIITTVVSTVAGLFLESTYGYVISRRDYRYRQILAFFVFFTMLFNGGLVPTYILISKWLHLKDNILALIIPVVCNAWHIMMLKGFFQSIPTSLIESAKIDGAKEFTIFFKIIIPLSKPALATIGLFILLASWNEWYSSLLYITSENKVKLQYLLMTIMKNIQFLNSGEGAALAGSVGAESLPTMSARMAMCVLAAGPIVAVFPFFQKYFVKGITVGAVKG